MFADWARRCLPPRVKTPLKRWLGLPATRLHADWSVLAPIGPVESEHVVVDVGSHVGWFLHCWKDWCPTASIHAFEPASEAHSKSVNLYGSDPSIVFNAVGVGSQSGVLDLKVCGDSTPSNSFLEPAKDGWDAIGYRTGPITRRSVPVVTLDEYCAQTRLQSIYLMKIDVQGFELEVLKGAVKTLRHTDYLFVESAIQRLYVDAATFTTVHDYLVGRGFHLMALRAWHRGNRVLVETDMLFRRNDLAPVFDPRVDKVSEELSTRA